MKNLNEYTEEELQAELKRRADAAEAQEKADRLEMCQLVLKHRDVLKQFMRHSRRSCENGGNAYYHPEHGAAQCNLCCLEDLDERDDIEILVDVQLVEKRKDRR